ncbi:TPA: hypothetical protein ACH3X3_010983 [Trebouxia sp. C0006]
MARLPASLAAQLPITFTHSGAMDDDMLHHIHHDVMKGLSFQAACDRAASFLQRNHNQAELEFLSWWNYQQQPGTQTVLDGPALSGAPPQCGTFGSAGHSKPYLSSSQYAAGIWLETYRPLAAFAFAGRPCVNVIKRRGARRQDKPVDAGVEPQTEADRQLYFGLRREYHENDGSPLFSKIADMINARWAAQVFSHGKANLLPEQMLNPTNPSRLKSFGARLAAEAERRAGQTLTAAMEYEVAEAHRVRARQVAAAKRAECKQRLDAKRSSHPVVAPGAPREYKPNNRGGKNTQPRCTTCGELKKGTHPRSGCPLVAP